METLRKWMVSLAAAFCLGAVGYAALSVKSDVHDTAESVQETSTQASAALTLISSSANANLNVIGQAVATNLNLVETDIRGIYTIANAWKQPVADLIDRYNVLGQNAQYAVLNVGLTANTVRLAATKEASTLDNWNSHINKTFDDSDALLLNFNGLTTQIRDEFGNADYVTMRKHITGMTVSGDSMLSTFDKVETKATHNYLNPSHNPFVRTWQATSPFLLPAAEIGAVVAK